MPDTGWIPSEHLLPREGREVITASLNRWGLRKGYIAGGRWFDLAHRPIEVHYWKPGKGRTQGEGASTLQYGAARQCLDRIIATSLDRK